jgi:hemerythrin-like domain-containing protein
MSVLEKMRSTLGAYPDTDVRGLLHADHVRIRELAKDLAEADSAPRRKALLRELKPFLTAHSRSEESAVYAPLMELRNSPDSRLAGNEGMVEHNLADIVMERLANTSDATSDMWKAHAKVLHEALEHHIKEEESELFEELGEHFSDAEREIMAAQFLQGKESFPVAPGVKASRRRPVAEPFNATRAGSP